MKHLRDPVENRASSLYRKTYTLPDRWLTKPLSAGQGIKLPLSVRVTTAFPVLPAFTAWAIFFSRFAAILGGHGLVSARLTFDPHDRFCLRRDCGVSAFLFPVPHAGWHHHGAAIFNHPRAATLKSLTVSSRMGNVISTAQTLQSQPSSVDLAAKSVMTSHGVEFELVSGRCPEAHGVA